ncbi:MAG: DnaA/Hda family protein [Pirellulaceae bacterium]|nr:DnaA/Hda family protein [Pirellulaceae bacterium]
MTVGIATLSLEPVSKVTSRRSKASAESGALLREFLLGPENALIKNGIGLTFENNAPSLAIQYHPLLITAPAGYGKTQLLHALAATWSRQNDQEQVTLLSASEFVHSYLEAIKLDDVSQFQQRYCRPGLLLIDNLNELRDSPKTQHTLSNIIDHRHRFERPTVFAASQPLHALKLSARLESRLSHGVCVPLQLPSADTRKELLMRLCQQRNLKLGIEVQEHLANRTQTSIPQLIGLVNQIITSNIDPSCPVEFSQIEKLLDSDIDPLDPRKIIRATARHFGLKVTNVTGASRRKMDALARSVAMFLIRELTPLSYQQIGQLFQQRDHSTVMHACRKVQRMIDSDSTTRSAVHELERALSPHAA